MGVKNMKKISLLSILFLLSISLFAISAQAAIRIDSVLMSPDHVAPGTSSTGTIRVTNLDNANSVTVSLTSSILNNGPEGIDAPIINQLTLAAGLSTTQTFTLSVPENKAPGTYLGTITATDVSNANNVATKGYPMVVDPQSDFEIQRLTDGKLTISTQRDTAKSKTFTIKNKGNVALNNVKAIITGNFTDNDNDILGVKVSNNPATSLTPGASTDVTITTDANSDIDIGTYTGQITITSISSPQLTPKTFDLIINIDPSICSDGRKSKNSEINTNNEGILRVNIDDPSSGDDFNPGQKIRIRGKAENHDSEDLDVIVEATLYNIDKGKEIDNAQSDSFSVSSDNDENFDFELQVPNSDDNLKEGNKYKVFIKVFEDGNEDENCNYDDVKVDFKRKDHDVILNNAQVSPTLVSCGANANFVMDVQNVGKKDEDIVTARLRDVELGLDFESDPFSLKKFDKSGDSATATYSFKIPSDATPRDYSIDAAVLFDNGRKTNSKFVKLTVKCSGNEPGVTGSAKVSLVQGTVSAVQGKLFGLPYKLSNLGTTTQVYTIEFTPNGDWADKPQSQEVTLQGGQETTLYAYLTPKASLSSGSYTIDIKAKQGNNILTTQTASVQVGEVTNTGGETPTGSTAFQPTITANSIWRNLANSVAFWIVAIIVLFALVVYILSALLRPR